MKEKVTPPSRYWQAYITRTTDDFLRRNMTIGVVAPNMHTAIALVFEAHPDAEIWTVQHRGEVNLGVIDMKFTHGVHSEDKGGVKW